MIECQTHQARPKTPFSGVFATSGISPLRSRQRADVGITEFHLPWDNGKVALALPEQKVVTGWTETKAVSFNRPAVRVPCQTVEGNCDTQILTRLSERNDRVHRFPPFRRASRGIDHMQLIRSKYSVLRRRTRRRRRPDVIYRMPRSQRRAHAPPPFVQDKSPRSVGVAGL